MAVGSRLWHVMDDDDDHGDDDDGDDGEFMGMNFADVDESHDYGSMARRG